MQITVHCYGALLHYCVQRGCFVVTGFTLLFVVTASTVRPKRFTYKRRMPLVRTPTVGVDLACNLIKAALWVQNLWVQNERLDRIIVWSFREMQSVEEL
jgi:hypothetical protein